jgi:hypothetical protein
MNWRRSLLLILAALATACGAAQQSLRVELTPPAYDGRAEFRQVFCGVLARKGAPAGACEDVLWRFPGERAAEAAKPVSGPLSRRWRVILVSGIASDCLSRTVSLYGDGRAAVRRLGVYIVDSPISGLASSEWNAAIVARTVEDQILTGDEGLMVVGYSKGMADILAALSLRPEISARIDAIVAVSGAFDGSRLAERAPAGAARLIAALPGLTCEPSDAKAIESMKARPARPRLDSDPARRPPVFALMALSDEATTSLALRPSWLQLSREAGPNDGQLAAREQIASGAILLGFARADHWGVALPIATSAPLLAPIATTSPQYPRQALFEALVRFVDAQVR